MTSEPDNNPNDLTPAQPYIEPVPQSVEQAQDQRRFPWRLFFLLAGMMLVASLLIVPYSVKLASVGNPQIAEQVPMVVVSSLIQTVVLYFPMLWFGLAISRRLELGAPYLQAISEGRPLPGGFRRALIPTAVLGFGMGAIVLLLSGVFSRVLPSELTSLSPEAIPSAFQGFLASIAAGINEEILLRLFMLSLIAWLVQRVVTGKKSGRPSTGILWAANLLAALIFGLLHLPNLAMMNLAITPAILAYVLLLNGLAGLGFGWLYWTFGLEAAMLAHFFADIVLHVIARLFA